MKYFLVCVLSMAVGAAAVNFYFLNFSNSLLGHSKEFPVITQFTNSSNILLQANPYGTIRFCQIEVLGNDEMGRYSCGVWLE